MENMIFNLCIVLQLFLSFDFATSFQIVDLNMPILIDPRDELVLDCHYDMGTEELYSVKWYKDEQEFFRYTPRQQPHVMSFPVAGVHLVPGGGICNNEQCRVRLSGLSTAHSCGSYRCEVSTEAPTFRVAFAIGNVTVAAVGRHEPRIEGFRDVYAPADLVYVNCTAAPSDPAPTITWLLNGQPAPLGQLGPMRTSLPDARGLVTAYRDLRFHAERRHFSGPGRTLRLECVAALPPDVPAPAFTTALTVKLNDPQPDAAATQQRNVLGNQKLEWINSQASIQFAHQGAVFGLIVTAFCWR